MKVGRRVENPLKASLLLLFGDDHHIGVNHIRDNRRGYVLSKHAS